MRIALALCLAALAGQAHAATAEVYFVTAVNVADGGVALQAVNVETNGPARLTLRTDEALVDLSAAEQTGAAKIVPGTLLFTGEGGRVSTLLFPGSRVHDSFARKDPARAADLDKLSASMADRVRTLAAAPADVDREIGAFLFVLEFALAAPLGVAQEDEIRKAAQTGATGGKAFAGYAQFVPLLLALDEGSRASMQSELEKSVKEWLASSDASDPAVKAVRTQLAARGRVAAPGTPPLTEMAATAFAELYAFSLALGERPEAPVSQIDPKEVAALRKLTIGRWSHFAPKERESIASLPGRWVVIRRVLEFGTAEEQAKLRASLRKLNAASGSPAAAKNDDLRHELARRQLAGFVREQVQQMTFNHYLWSRGFNYGPATGKLW